MDIQLKPASASDNPGELMAYPMALTTNRVATEQDETTNCPHCDKPCLYNQGIIEADKLYHGRLIAVCTECALRMRTITLTAQQRHVIFLATERYLDWFRYGKHDMNPLLDQAIGKCFKFVQPETGDLFAMMPVKHGSYLDQLYYRMDQDGREGYVVVPLNRSNRLLLQFELGSSILPALHRESFQILRKSFKDAFSLPFLNEYLRDIGVAYEPSPEP